MSPSRTGGRNRGGNLRFDRVFSGVGRIACSSGTGRLAEFRKRDAILTKLHDNAQLEVLRAFQRGEVTIEHLAEADRVGRLSGADLIADMALRRPLWPTVDDLLPKLGKGPETRRRYGTSLRALRARAPASLPNGARLADLERLDWVHLESVWGGSAADWNHLRRAVSTLLTVVLGDVHHPIRRSVMKRIPLRGERPRVPDLSGKEFWKIVNGAPEHAQPAYVVLAASGMRLGEYLRCTPAHLDAAAHGIRVPGTKTTASADTVFVDPELWPWVEAGVPAPLQRRWLWMYWRRACAAVGRPDLRLHDLRHFYAQLADAGGASTESVMAALRHTNPATTRGYKTRKVKGEVAHLVGRALTAASAN